MSHPTLFSYPRPRVDVAEVPAVSQAGAVLLTDTIHATGLAASLRNTLELWTKPLAGPGTVLDVSLAHPVRQTGLGDPEVLRDHRELLTRFTVPRNADDVVTELLGIRCGHGAHPSLRRSPAPQFM